MKGEIPAAEVSSNTAKGEIPAAEVSLPTEEKGETPASNVETCGKPHTAVVTDNIQCRRHLARFFEIERIISFQDLMKSVDAAPFIKNCSYLQIDIPGGSSRMCATKIDTLTKYISAWLTINPDLKISCLVPYRKGQGFPHKRWSRFTKAWKPQTSSHCSCKCLQNEKYWHLGMRIFTNFGNPQEKSCTLMPSKSNKTISCDHEAEAASYLRRQLYDALYTSVENGSSSADGVYLPVAARNVEEPREDGNEDGHAYQTHLVGRNTNLPQLSNCQTLKTTLTQNDPSSSSNDDPTRTPIAEHSNQNDPSSSSNDDSTRTPSAEHTFPTDAKARQKERDKANKEKGIVKEVKKRRKLSRTITTTVEKAWNPLSTKYPTMTTRKQRTPPSISLYSITYNSS